MEPEAHGQGAELNDLLNGSQEATQDNPAQAKQRCEDELPRRDVEELSEDGSGERPVRQKLKETSIAGLSRQPSPEDQPMPSQEPTSTDDNDRGRLRRKRSYDESRDADPADAESKKEDDGGHRRKRSRDSKEENSSDQEKEAEPIENRERTPSALRAPANEANKLLSPKKKRGRDQLDKDDLKLEKNEAEKTGQAKNPADGEKPGLSATNRTEEGEPEKKRHRDDSRERDVSKDDSSKASFPNPFANTSATSPFASLDACKLAGSRSKDEAPKTQPVTSASAFASSGLAAFASSEKSPFGTIGSNASVFKSMKQAETSIQGKENVASATTATPSPLAATGASPFASFSGGFASSAFASFTSSAPQSSGRLTSFASPASTTILGGGPKTKPFGAASDGEEEEDDQGEDESRPAFEGLEEVKRDDRFFKQETETGEENEKTWYSCRGKLFQFDGKEWKERGIGTFKINVVETEESSASKRVVRSARMIMRTDAVLRVVLNSPLFKGMKVGDATGNEPTGKQIHLVGMENGKSTPYLLRTASLAAAKDAYHNIQDILLKF
uniref:RanBD1 domain-containing protein n=1 Tax=Coccidioides posadasii RMSCC 3488 TaxID=454284 RepID=A0A0J6FIG1_COCPO|nr:hypothetical protein CPAG_04935 [Coccidioides posadasii RMSCC 3488]